MGMCMPMCSRANGRTGDQIQKKLKQNIIQLRVHFCLGVTRIDDGIIKDPVLDAFRCVVEEI